MFTNLHEGREEAGTAAPPSGCRNKVTVEMCVLCGGGLRFSFFLFLSLCSFSLPL